MNIFNSSEALKRNTSHLETILAILRTFFLQNFMDSPTENSGKENVFLSCDADLLYISLIWSFTRPPWKSKMASNKECSFQWCSVYEETLSKLSTTNVFFNAVTIWIERPQVLNRRLIGSYILKTFKLALKKCDFLAKISIMTRQNGNILKGDFMRIVESYEGEIKEGENGAVNVKLRSLLPRETNKHSNVLELIIEGISFVRLLTCCYLVTKLNKSVLI